MAAMIGKRHRAAAFAGVLLALAGCARGPERVVERRVSNQPAPRGATLLRITMLATHNRARADVGAPPLLWDEALAVSARAYAEEMARTRHFEHAVQPQGPTRQGENLWTGTRGAYAYDEMFGHWLAERRDFTNGATPMFSRTGRWEDVAHYTQIVWLGSRAVGCAIASNASDDYLVCRYGPAGNVWGERAL